MDPISAAVIPIATKSKGKEPFLFKFWGFLEATVVEFLRVDTDGNQIIKNATQPLQEAALLGLAADRDDSFQT